MRLKKRLLDGQPETQDGDKIILSFDKDDVDTLDFVASSSNLRAAIFGLEAKSKFDIKRMLWLPPDAQFHSILTNSRNGGQHHSCYCNYQCNDSCVVCFTGIQSSKE